MVRQSIKNSLGNQRRRDVGCVSMIGPAVDDFCIMVP